MPFLTADKTETKYGLTVREKLITSGKQIYDIPAF